MKGYKNFIIKMSLETVCDNWKYHTPEYLKELYKLLFVINEEYYLNLNNLKGKFKKFMYEDAKIALESLLKGIKCELIRERVDINELENEIVKDKIND